MSDLRDWLHRNKLEQYADAFEANDIDLDILPELSERDLEQLGLSNSPIVMLKSARPTDASPEMPSATGTIPTKP